MPYLHLRQSYISGLRVCLTNNPESVGEKMLVNKVTVGYVIQTYDTNLNRFVSQEFIAGDECEYTSKRGRPLTQGEIPEKLEEAYLPYDMRQPTSMTRV